MIYFSELKVYKRELLIDSPYTDRYMMLGQIYASRYDSINQI